MCAGLTHLDFCCLGHRRDIDITNEGVTALSALTNLRSVNLAGHTDISTPGISWLADCTSLTNLDLTGAPSA